MKRLYIAWLLVGFSAPATAYVGPGLGMGVIGTIFGVLAAVVLGVFGLLWYPLKRALKKKRTGAAGGQDISAVAKNEQAEHAATVPARPDTLAGARPEEHDTHQSGVADRRSESEAKDNTDSHLR